MAVMRIRLSTKMALGSFLVAGVGVFLFAFFSYSQVSEYFKANMLRKLSVDIDSNTQEIKQAIDHISEDILILSKSNILKGLIRASENKFHYDSVENLKLEDFKERLQEEFYRHIEQNKGYYQVRLIGIEDGGKEIIRIDSVNNTISIRPEIELQKKGNQYYFKNTIALKEGDTFISKINLNKEYGSIVFPIVPTIRVSMPIYYKNKLFGIIIINADINKLFNLEKYKNMDGKELYITNSNGDYLFHNDVDKTFSFEFQKDFNIKKDFAVTKLFIADRKKLSFYDEKDYAFYGRKIKIKDDFILIVGSATNIFLKEQSADYEKKMLWYIIVITFLIAIFSTLLTRYLTNPISRLTDRAKIVADTQGEKSVSFKDIKSNDEIGELAQTMEYMIENLIKSQKKLSLFASSLEDEVQKRTKEQEILLSIFDKGEAVLFKWNNDEEWSIASVSHSVSKLLGYSDKDFLSKSVIYSACIHEDDIVEVRKEVETALESKQYFFEHKPYRLVTKDGSIKWVHDYTIIVRDDFTHEILYFLGYLTDITPLKELNDQLEKKVAKGIDDLRDKEKLLTEQSKLASMGEMIGAIAHQWRQPLNELSINIQNLDDDYEDGVIDEEFVEEFIKDNTEVINFMSNTIDDFRNFFRIDKTKEFFSVKDAINQTLSIQGAQLKSHSVEVTCSGDDFNVNGYKSEFQQVILNIVNNAKDALVSKNIKDAKIEISLVDNKIYIKDNAGGVPDNVIDRIFEPYFTTKEQGKGTGMGLYMSSMIIRDNMNGTLEVKNIDDGAIFTIGFKNG